MTTPQTHAGDPAVRELQAILVRHGYLTEQQVQTGPGILGPKTRAAVDSILGGQGQDVPAYKVATVGNQGTKPSGTQVTQEKHTSFYIVQAGESPEEIAKRVGVPLNQILSHPENAFMKERQQKGGYPLHPGDRIALPGKAPQKFKPVEPKHDPSTSSSIIDYLLELTHLHPALSLLGAGMPTQQKSTPTNQKPVTKTTTKGSTASTQKSSAVVLPTQGYSKKHPRIRPRVVLTPAIESAFLLLVDYLPKSTVMTSGYRSDADQARIINEYYDAHKGNPLEKDVEKRRQWLVKSQGLTIARVGSSPHRTGFAFDLSGGSLDQIKAAVAKCAKEHGARFPLLNTITERKQNCLHVNLKPVPANKS